MLLLIRDILHKWHAVRRFWYAFRLWLLPLSGGAEVANEPPELLSPSACTPVLMERVLRSVETADARYVRLFGTGRGGEVVAASFSFVLPALTNHPAFVLGIPDLPFIGAKDHGLFNGPEPDGQRLSLKTADLVALRSVWKWNGR